MDSLRDRVAYVTQDVQLLKASVRDNLTFFDSGVRDDKLVAALESVGLGEWYHSLPDGLDTQLASEGGGLSAGQAQLLAFARVFLKSPGFIILDEASSRLDPISEAHMEGAMDLLLGGRSAMIIAHRITTLDRADDILILSHGRILEYGSRQELAANPESNYARLLREGMEDMLA
jgi:ATP-binding cassette subfamily B protein